MNFWITFSAVGTMLLYAVPGYVFIKTKMVKESSIPSFAVVLMYLCQPALTIYSITRTEFQLSFLKTLILFFFATLIFQVALLLLNNLIFSKIGKETRLRVCTAATCMGNCGFFGVPLLETLLPDYPQAIALACIFMLSMNVMGWTLSCAIIANDKKYVSFKKAFFNPTIIGMVIAFPLYIFSVQLPSALDGIITVLAKMTTPLCMIIMGMRLATMEIKSIFSDPFVYLTVGIKQIIMPLLIFAIMYFLPIDPNVKVTLFILCATPVASVVLNFAELIKEGQQTAAKLVLFGTFFSIITIPFILLLV